uniref:Uncharacterized protein n=1 Tax=Clytia hemisphaerica TaxID=252671 RepID=A0A7M5UQS3_9CNID
PGCYVTIKDKKSGAVNSFKDFELVYLNSVLPNQVQSYHFQIWNCDNESVSFWSNVENSFVEKYFTLEQDNSILRTRNLSIWQGHAIRIIFDFNDAGQPNQCLFIKVPGTLVYPAVIKDIDASKASDVFVPPSVFIQPSSSSATSLDPTTTTTSITSDVFVPPSVFIQPSSSLATSLDPTTTTTSITSDVFVPPSVFIQPSSSLATYFNYTIIPTTSFRNTTSPTEEPPVVNNAPVIAGVTTSLAFLLVFSAALFYVLRKKLKKRQTVLPDDQLVLDETHSTSSSITNKSLSSAHEVENDADEKKEPVQTDYVMEFKGVDEYD